MKNSSASQTKLQLPPDHIPLPRVFADLRRESSASVIASGELPPLNAQVYVEDSIDRELLTWVRQPGPVHLVVLTGSAGHGKSAAIARAAQEARNLGKALRIRYDATHSDGTKESYREALSEFLAPFEDGRPAASDLHLLAMNLGKALEFFSDESTRKRWSGLGKRLDEVFNLGLRLTCDARSDVRVINFAERFQLAVRGEAPTLPFVEDLLERFDAGNPSTPVAKAIERECAACSRQGDCPVLANARILSTGQVRANFVHALAAGSIKGGVHLTPRALLDTISRAAVPPALLERSTSSEQSCGLRIAANPGFGPNDKWGQRLDNTLFSLLFPNSQQTTGTPTSSSENKVLHGLAAEDPAAIREPEWDDAVLSWAADPNTLVRRLPPVLLDYLKSPSDSLGTSGYARLIRALRWIEEKPERRPDTQRLNTFVSLCLNHGDARAVWTERLPTSFERIAAGAFYDDPNAVGQKRIAIRLAQGAAKFEVLADLHELRAVLSDAPLGKSANHASFSVKVHPKGRPEGPQFIVTWQTFDVLWDIWEGYAPPAGGGLHSLFLEEVGRRLIGNSRQEESLIVRELASGQQVSLEASQSMLKKVRIEAKLK